MRAAKIGLALGSGAARGWAHIGVLEVLNEAGITPHVVCGTSMGALVGGAHVCGRLGALKDWALAANWRVVASMVDVGFLAGGLVDGVRIVKLLDDLGVAVPIERLKVPYAAVATDVTTGREIWLRSGPLDTAIRASIAMPGIFSPIEVDGRWLVDGGLVNPVPVSLCRALGADFIIAVNVNEDLLGRRLTRPPAEAAAEPTAEEPTPEQAGLLDLIKSLPRTLRAQAQQIRLFGGAGTAPGYFDVLANSINIMQDRITRSRLAGEPPHALVVPHLADVALMDFHRAAEAIAEGRAAAERALPAIEARMRAAL